ncbi:MAG: cache domain-containing protein, partial [Lentisphaerota bacterium]
MNKPTPIEPLRRQVLFTLFLGGLLPVILMMGITQVFTRKAMMDYEYNKMSILADQTAQQIEQEVRNASSAFDALRNTWSAEWQHHVEKDSKQPWQPSGSDPAGSGITLYDRRGVLVTPSAQDPLRAATNSRPFQRALSGELALVPPCLQPGGSNLQMGAYMPITNQQGMVDYIAWASRPLDRIQQLVGRIHLGQEGYFTLLDSTGNVLFHPDAKQVMSRFDSRIPSRFWTFRPRGVYLTRQADRYAFVSVALDFYRSGLERAWTLVGLKPYHEVLIFPQQEMRLQLGVT